MLCKDSAAIPGQSCGNSDIGSDFNLLLSTAHSTTALRSQHRHSSTNDEQDYLDDGEQEGSGVGFSQQSTGMSHLILAKTLINKHKATQREHIDAEERDREELNACVTALEAQVTDLSEINKCLSLTVACPMGKFPTETYLDVHPPQSRPHGSQTVQTTVVPLPCSPCDGAKSANIAVPNYLQSDKLVWRWICPLIVPFETAEGFCAFPLSTLLPGCHITGISKSHFEAALE